MNFVSAILDRLASMLPHRTANIKGLQRWDEGRWGNPNIRGLI